jgi:GDP-4-dehydro-6-deoxy-D-mannose reductase
MKALITGAGGFIGSHLADSCVAKGLEVVALTHGKTDNLNHLKGKIRTLDCDIADKDAVFKIVAETKPDYVFHFAAQSFVMPSWKDPEGTFKSNIIGTRNILEAVREAGIDPLIVLACSSAAYGFTLPSEIPISETKEFRPSSPYAISKAATDHLGHMYARRYGMRILRLRIFNTIGPRKTGSALAEWSEQIAKIESKKQDVMKVGNLEGTVDFTDIRDFISAVWLLVEKGEPGDAYNTCSGTGRKMSDVLECMKSLAKVPVKSIPDPAKFRPNDDPIFVGDNSKLRALGWKPQIPFEQTLQDTLVWWRTQV